MIFTILLNPSIDHILRVDNFKAGKTLKALHSRQLPLGKGMNVACSVAALNEKVKILGLMGNHDEPFYNEFAALHQVACEWSLVDERVRHNVTVIDLEKNGVTHIREPGFRVSRKSILKIQEKIISQVKADDWVAFCGSLPMGASVKTYRELITACSEKTKNIILDTSGKALIEGIRGKPLAIKPNLAEFEELFGEKINGIKHIALKAKSLIDRGIQNIFVSLGQDGLLAVNSKFALRAKVHIAKSGNTVGCGDAMLAGLIVGMKRGYSFSKICELGVSCGTANTIATGPGLIKRTDVMRLMDNIEKISI